MMDSNRKSVNQFSSGFSDDDGIADDYEEDFLSDSSNDSFEDFLKTKLSKSSPTSKPTTTLTSGDSSQVISSKIKKNKNWNDLLSRGEKEKFTPQQPNFDLNFDGHEKLPLSSGSTSPLDFLKKNSSSKLHFEDDDLYERLGIESKNEKTAPVVFDKRSTSPYSSSGNDEKNLEFLKSSKSKKSSNNLYTPDQKLKKKSLLSLLDDNKEEIQSELRSRPVSPFSAKDFLKKKKVEFQANDIGSFRERNQSLNGPLGKTYEDPYSYSEDPRHSNFEPIPRDMKEKQKSLLREKNKADGFQSKYSDYLFRDPNSFSIKDRSDVTSDENALSDQKRLGLQDFQKPKAKMRGSATRSSSPNKIDKNIAVKERNAAEEISPEDFLSTLPSFDEKNSKASSKELKPQKLQRPRSAFVSGRASGYEQKTAADEIENKKESVSADDLMALFQEVKISGKPIFDEKHGSKIKKTKEAKRKNIFNQLKATSGPLNFTRINASSRVAPSQAFANDLMKETRSNLRTARQINDDVISSVAMHNHDVVKNALTTEGDQEKLPPKKSGKKKQRPAPPRGYEGLGSLSALKKLRSFNSGSEDIELDSTTDIKSLAYMQWLADREAKLRKKKKLKVKEDEKENEEKLKEKQEKFLENESARKAWAEKKEILTEEEFEKQKANRQRMKEERLRLEEEKMKSQKRAEVARKQLVLAAKRRHQIEAKTKKEDEMIQTQKEEDKRRRNELAVKIWEEERSKRWENDRKRELRDQRKKEQGMREHEEEKKEKAKVNFQRWKMEKKKKRPYSSRINYHEEEKPPWNPPNKYL